MYTADEATSWHLTADLAVVGASSGGLLAAIAAARRGCRVVVCERTKELGGSLTRSRGMLPAAGTRPQRDAGVTDDADAFANDLLAQSPRDPELTRAMCHASTALVEWLAEANVTQLVFVPGLVAPGHVVPRLHGHPAGTGADLANDLIGAASRQSHIAVRTGCVVEDMWVDGSGSVVGVAAREKRGPINIQAGRVLLACGGFAANVDLVREHQPEVATIPYLGIPGALGDALRWGSTFEAATEGLESAWISPFVTTPGGFVVPSSVVRNGAILVNQLGHRFADESNVSLELVRKMLEQPGRMGYLIFDERIYQAVRAVDPYFARWIVPRAVRKDGNPADLARHFEIEADDLLPTIDAFHAGVVRRTDPFGRTDAGAPFTPPFFGARVTAARLRTLGGLKIDDTARVLRSSGAPIPNLLASGGAVAHPVGSDSDGSGLETDLFSSLVWGWVAGAGTSPQTDDGEG